MTHQPAQADNLIHLGEIRLRMQPKELSLNRMVTKDGVTLEDWNGDLWIGRRRIVPHVPEELPSKRALVLTDIVASMLSVGDMPAHHGVCELLLKDRRMIPGWMLGKKVYFLGAPRLANNDTWLVHCLTATSTAVSFYEANLFGTPWDADSFALIFERHHRAAGDPPSAS